MRCFDSSCRLWLGFSVCLLARVAWVLQVACLAQGWAMFVVSQEALLPPWFALCIWRCLFWGYPCLAVKGKFKETVASLLCTCFEAALLDASSEESSVPSAWYIFSGTVPPSRWVGTPRSRRWLAVWLGSRSSPKAKKAEGYFTFLDTRFWILRLCRKACLLTRQRRRCDPGKTTCPKMRYLSVSMFPCYFLSLKAW